MRYLGVDPGARRLGLALGNDLLGLASPLEIVPYEGVTAAAAAIAERARSHGAAGVVIGLPTLQDGSEGPACARSHALAEALTGLGVTVWLQPELLTTNEARRRARALGRPRERAVDDLAAQVLLEEFLAERARHGE